MKRINLLKVPPHKVNTDIILEVVNESCPYFLHHRGKGTNKIRKSSAKDKEKDEALDNLTRNLLSLSLDQEPRGREVKCLQESLQDLVGLCGYWEGEVEKFERYAIETLEVTQIRVGGAEEEQIQLKEKIEFLKAAETRQRSRAVGAEKTVKKLQDDLEEVMEKRGKHIFTIRSLRKQLEGKLKSKKADFSNEWFGN